MPSGRNSILCPNCRRLVSRDEPRCPYCGIPNPGTWWKNNPLTQLRLDADRLVVYLIGANVVLFILSVLLNPGDTGLGFNPFTLFAPSNKSLILLGATGTVPIERLGHWWSLLTATYLHGGVLHLLFNMMAFRQLAPLTIREYGPQRMFAIYTLAGVAGFAVSFVVGVPLTIGASAAICGLMGALFYYGRSRGGAYGTAIYRQIGGWAIGLFLFGLLVPGINNWAHGGGLLAGLACAWLVGYEERRPASVGVKLLGGICALATAAALLWAVGTSLYYVMLA